MTNAMGLMSEMTKGFDRKDSHFTVDGVRALVEYQGYLYCVDVKAIVKVADARMKDVGLEDQQEQMEAAPDGSC